MAVKFKVEILVNLIEGKNFTDYKLISVEETGWQEENVRLFNLHFMYKDKIYKTMVLQFVNGYIDSTKIGQYIFERHGGDHVLLSEEYRYRIEYSPEVDICLYALGVDKKNAFENLKCDLKSAIDQYIHLLSHSLEEVEADLDNLSISLVFSNFIIRPARSK